MAIMTIPRPVCDNGEEFGTIVLKDKEICAKQSAFAEYAIITEEKGVTKIDISGVSVKCEFYISSKEPLETFIGCNAYDYEVKNAFYNYRIVPLCKTMTFDNV